MICFCSSGGNRKSPAIEIIAMNGQDSLFVRLETQPMPISRVFCDYHFVICDSHDSIKHFYVDEKKRNNIHVKQIKHQTNEWNSNWRLNAKPKQTYRKQSNMGVLRYGLFAMPISIRNHDIGSGEFILFQIKNPFGIVWTQSKCKQTRELFCTGLNFGVIGTFLKSLPLWLVKWVQNQIESVSFKI